MARLFKQADGPKDQVFRLHLDTVRKLPAEANAAALDQALIALEAFCEYSEAGPK